MPLLSKSTGPFLTALMGFLALSGVASAQTVSALPATPPTAAPAANSLPAPIVATAESGTPRRRAKVTYTGGLLNVQANNSSLNGILRDIAQATGMKITGGVADQRVFGNYGPAEPSTILATLLDGTGSNILLRERADNAPSELILTPRNGGVTPPNPDAAGFDGGREDEGDDLPAPQPAQQQVLPQSRPFTPLGGNQQPATSGPPSIPQPFNNVLGSPNNTTPSASTLPTVNSIPTDSLATPSTAVPVSGIVDSVNPVPPGSTTFGTSTVPTSATSDSTTSNGAKTPEQIFQQLQQMRQAAAQQNGSGTSSSNNSTTPNSH